MEEKPRTYEWDTRKVPENNKETPLFVVDIPGLGNALFALGACVDVEASCEDHESHVLREK